MSDSTRLDKWLWAARFFKTRSLATHAIDLGRVMQNKQRVKPAHQVKAGDVLEIQHGDARSEVVVLRILEMRGPAAVAQTMYQETEDSLARKAAQAEERRYYREPAEQIQGRPTKRDRRQIDQNRY